MSEETKDHRVSVLVVVTDHARELTDVQREAEQQFAMLGVEPEFIYLVNARSREVLDQVRQLAQSTSQLQVIEFAPTVGEAAMLTAGFERAQGELLFTLPGHYAASFDALGELYRALQEGADMAFASRGTKRSSRIQSRVFNKLISWAAGTQFTDIASGTRALRRRVLDEIPLYGDFHRYLPVLAERLGFRILEVPAQLHPKSSNPVVHAPRLYLWRTMDILSIFFLSRFTRRPLRLFGGVGSLFALIGGTILSIVTVQRFMGTALADRPILILGTLLVGLGVQIFTIGLLGELILFFHARNIRDYRVAGTYEADEPPLPERDSR